MTIEPAGLPDLETFERLLAESEADINAGRVVDAEDVVKDLRISLQGYYASRGVPPGAKKAV